MIDPSIALQGTYPQFVNPLDAALKAAAIRNAQDTAKFNSLQQQNAQMDLDARRKAIADQQAIQGAWLQAAGITKPDTASPAALPAAAPAAPAAAAGPAGPANPNTVAPDSLASFLNPQASPAAPSPSAAPAAIPAASGASAGAPAPSYGEIDPTAITRALTAQGKGYLAPAAIESANKYNEALHTMQKQAGEADLLAKNAAGALGLAVKNAGYDPHAFLAWSQRAAAINPREAAQLAPAVKQIQAALAQDPSGASAQAATQRAADYLISISPEQQEAINKAKTAQSEADKGTAALQNSNREQFEADTQTAAKMLSQAPNAAIYGQLRGMLKPEVAKQFPDKESWTAQTPAAVLQMGMKPDQIATLAETSKKDAETRDYQKQTLGIDRARLGIEQGRLSIDQQKAAATGALGDLPPVYQQTAADLSAGKLKMSDIARFPAALKAQLVSAAHQLNPNFSDQTSETRDSFLNPEKKQGQNLQTVARIVGHIGRYQQNSDNLGVLERADYGAGTDFSGNAKALTEDAHALSGELEKLNSGGVGSEGQIKAWQAGLRSPMKSARDKAIREISQLVGSQYEGMAQAYKNGTGQDLPVDKLLTPEGIRWMNQNGINPTPGAAAAPAAGAPSLANVSTADLFKLLGK